MQDYRQVAGRVTAVAIDPADPTGNTVFVGAAQGGIWKSTNAAYNVADNVAWNAISDNQATLSIGSIAIQPGNSDPAKSVILAATGEANNSADSYFGLGILRSNDAGSTWNLISSAILHRVGRHTHGFQYCKRADERGRFGDGDKLGRPD